MDNKLKLAFTLVELLVVIAIVGILSGLIIVGMTSSVNSARIAKAQIFSTSLRDSLMMNLSAEWKLEGNGNDTWGTNNCTWSGSAGGTNTSANYRPESECVYGQCLNFDGTDDYLSCGSGVPISTNNFTWSFWGKTSNALAQTAIYRAAAGITGWIGYFSLPWGATSNVLFYVVSTSYTKPDLTTGSIYRYVNPASNPSNSVDNKWHYFVGSCDRTKAAPPDVYMDGILANGANGTFNCSDFVDNVTTGTTFIGATGSVSYFNGNIDEVRMYNAAIPASQVRENYYAGLSRLLASGQFTKEEYQDKLLGLDINFAKN